MVLVLFDLILIGCLVLWMRIMMTTVLATSHAAVLRHLRKTGSARVRHVWRFEGVWNPAGRTYVDDRVYGPGEAHYTLDAAGMVHLEFQERGGRVRRFSGPYPVPVKRPEYKTTPHSRKLIRRAVVGFAAVMTTGFVIGYALGGPSSEHRIVDAGIGQLAAMSLALLAIALFGVKRRALTGTRSKQKSA